MSDITKCTKNIYLYNIKNKILEQIEEDDVMDKLYYLEYRLPTIDEIPKKISKDNPESFLEEIKNNISQVENKVPLYDIYADNIYLINNIDVYERVTRQFFRFPEKEFIKGLLERQKKYSKLKITNELNKRLYDILFRFI
jgi:hypothetical protein